MAAEDFTTYIENDPNNRVTVTSDLCDVNALPLGNTCQVYDDKGVDHFGASFEHLHMTIMNSFIVIGEATTYALSNTIEDQFDWETNNSEAFGLHWTQATLDFTDFETGDSDAVAGETSATQYWCTTERTSETSVSCEIYTDASRTSLLDTVTITITSGRRYRYVWAVDGYGSGAGIFGVNMDTGELDLQEAVAAAAPYIVGGGIGGIIGG